MHARTYSEEMRNKTLEEMAEAKFMFSDVLRVYDTPELYVIFFNDFSALFFSENTMMILDSEAVMDMLVNEFPFDRKGFKKIPEHMMGGSH